ncbi:MAG: hypothetical protein KDA99_29955, partial [Planctomycetales bacterium]|nr:hypothetical protein [Planctomycetales bacterium]
MNIALLQDEIYLPSYGGGTKANRYLLEQLAELGHRCLAITRARTHSADGPQTESQFSELMRDRGIIVDSSLSGAHRYQYRNVTVDALSIDDIDHRAKYIRRRLQDFAPDWVFVTDDKRRYMLQAALEAATGRVAMLLQTIVQLPFGPLAVRPCHDYTALMKKASCILVISDFAKDYIQTHSSLRATLVHLPVYGAGPFPAAANSTSGYITMINPCDMKGASIFLGLADQFANVSFAAVPTWGADTLLLS